MRKYILIFIVFIQPIVINAQLNPNTLLPNVMPSNPQAFQFMKYGEIPVKGYTGTPDISIPIYTLETKALNIPIVLNYHPNGIKVVEEASWVGLGWNLSTDMEIVQTVQGLDDFGKYKNRSLANFNCMIPLQASGLSAATAMSGCSTVFMGLDDDWNQNHSNCIFDPKFIAGTLDTEPDVFYFNAAGYSGKFTLNWNTNQFVCLTDKNIKIASGSVNNYDLSNTFIITVPDGHRFQFTLIDNTIITASSTNDASSGPIVSYIDPIEEVSSRVYKLTNIITSKADVIDFEYEKSQKNINGVISDAVSKNYPYISEVIRNEVSTGPETGTGTGYVNSISINPNSLVASGIESPTSNPYVNAFMTSYTATSQTYSYLKKIRYNGQLIEFITSSRQDLKEAKKLDQIIVSYRGTVKTFNFNYDYFIGNNQGNNWNSFLTFGEINPYTCDKTADEISKRLKLLSFNEIDQKPYIFDYNTQSLPLKTSYDLDYWGFYNGMHHNVSFVPNIYRFNIERNSFDYYHLQNNNNSPVLSYCKAATLEKITYPTGGSTVFEYELNTFNNYKVPPASQGNLVQFNIATNSTNPYHTMETVLIEGGNTIFNVYGLLSVHGCFPQYPDAYSNCYFRVTHFKKELLTWIKNDPIMNQQLQTYGINYVLGVVLDFLDDSPSNPTLYNQYKDIDVYFRKTFNGTGYVYEDEYVINQKVFLSEGIAVFRVSGACGVYNPTGGNWSQSSFTVNYMDYKPLPEGDSFGAGLRIKSITSYTASIGSIPSAPAFKKNYQYEGGKLMSPLLYYNKMPINYQDHRIVALNSSISFCTSLQSQISQLNFQIDLNFEKYKNNPNKRMAEYISSFFEQLKSLAEGNIYPICDGPNTTPVWDLYKSFIGYRNELHSQSYITPSTSASGRYVGYDIVTEKFEDFNATESSPRPGIGKEVSYYNNNPDMGAPPLDTGGGYYTQINLPPMLYFPENGNLTKKEVYNEIGVLKKQILNAYQYRQEPCLWGMKTLTTNVTDRYVGPSLGDYQKYAKYLVGVYPLQSGKTILTSSEVINFENGNEISELTNYEYDSHNQISKITEDRSNGDIVETYLDYPYNNNTYTGMVNRNMISQVIEKRKQINANVLSTEKSTYKWISTPNPDSYFQSAYALDQIIVLKDGQYTNPAQNVKYHNYDKDANPTEISMNDGTRISYIWGYNGKYPIAKIENASQPSSDNATQGYTIIPSNLSQAAITASNTGTEDDLIAALNNLRNSLPNAMVTTITYKPLIGPSTITDVQGNKVSYYYDSSNRLQFIKDTQGNILSENQYHFRP